MTKPPHHLLQRIPFLRTQTDNLTIVPNAAEKGDPLITTRLLTPIDDDLESQASSPTTSSSTSPSTSTANNAIITTLTHRLHLARGIICVLSFTTLAFFLLFLSSLAHNQSSNALSSSFGRPHHLVPSSSSLSTHNSGINDNPIEVGEGEKGGGGYSPTNTFPSLQHSGALTYTRHTFPVTLKNNPFAGPPRPELDAAWHELFENIRVRVSAKDLEFYNVSSIPLAQTTGGGEGGGVVEYAAELGVHHELHCLKKIRHWIYRDYYGLRAKSDGGNLNEGELGEMEAHIDHCVEMIREAIVCRGDTTLSSFEWVEVGDVARVGGGNGGGKEGGGNGRGDGGGTGGGGEGVNGGEGRARLTAVAKGWHTCVNWDSLMGWVRERHVKVFEEGVLEGPGQMGL